MFRRLPNRVEDVQSAVTKVSLEDVECVTVTAVNVHGPSWYLQIRKGINERDMMNPAAMLKSDPVQKQLVEEEFTAKYSNWESADLDELQWDKVKDLQVRELLAERQKVGQIAQGGHCLTCPDFLRHVSASITTCRQTKLTCASSVCNTANGWSRRIF